MVQSQTQTFENTVSELIKELVDLEFDIQQEISELGNSAWTTKEVQEANVLIKSKLSLLHNKIKEVKLFGKEQDLDTDKQYVLDKLPSHKTQLERLRKELQKANVNCQKNRYKKYEEERAALFEGSEAALQKRKLKTRRDILRSTENLTDSLNRIHNRMNAETDRSSEILKELAKASNTIEQTIAQHDSLKDSIHRGKSVFSRLRRRDFTDKILIYIGLCFFLLVVLYILKKRLQFTLFGFWS